jgi:polyisoprenoid-binding protein YceI
MSTAPLPSDTPLAELASGAWRVDPARSSVEFHVPHFWGLITVKGRFERYDGTLDLQSQPAVQLTIQADSLDTSNRKRDQHLRSADFFDAEREPQVRFVSNSACSTATRSRCAGGCTPPARASRSSSTRRSSSSTVTYRSKRSHTRRIASSG